MRNEILERVAVDLLSIPPLLFREIRRKLVKTTLASLDADITPLHFEIIRLLSEEGTTHVAEIGEKLQIAKAQMTQLIDKLVSLNIIERKTDALDRRITNINITEQGKIILKEHKKILMDAIRESMSGLTDKELEKLSASLRNIRDIITKLQ